ncbi:MAG TPA: dihydrodipicolinate synthase family protein, partial [Blastocatellia bacterium]
MNYTPRPGLNVPIITVLDDSSKVIADQQRRVIRHIVQNGYGADVIFGVGTTGEWNRLANAERQRIMEIEIDELRRINTERRGSRVEDGRSRIEDRTDGATLDLRSSIFDPRSVE